MNLYDLLKANGFRGLDMDTIRVYALSILQCLSMLHRESIIHCDLKPVSVYGANECILKCQTNAAL